METFDLVIAACPPSDIGTGIGVDVARLLNCHGTLVVITHGQATRGVPYGPVAEVVNTLSGRGLGWLDHMVVESGEMPHPLGAVGLPVRTIHNDVLVFGGPEERAADRSEDSGD